MRANKASKSTAACQVVYAWPHTVRKSSKGFTWEQVQTELCASDISDFDSWVFFCPVLSKNAQDPRVPVWIQISLQLDRLLSKLPSTCLIHFFKDCLRDGILQNCTILIYTPQDLATCLQTESLMWQYCVRLIFSGWLGGINQVPYPERNQRLCGFMQRRRQLRRRQPMHSIQNPTSLPPLWQSWPLSNSCEEFRKLNIDQVSKWLEDGKWCQKCRHHHTKDRCTLKSPCKTSDMHLAELHESIQEHKPKRYTDQSSFHKSVPGPAQQIPTGDGEGGQGSSQ